MPQSSPPQDSNKRNPRLDFLLLLSIAILSLIEFSAFLASNSFGSEFPQFFPFTYGKPLGEVLRFYTQLDSGWYRPTQFFLPYWLGERMMSWHNPHAWRAYELSTLLMVCGLIYWLVLVLLPGRRLAAFTAALYFTCVPVINVPLYEIAAFDFFHIVFALLCIIAFTKGYRLRNWRGVAWTVLAALSYALALTSKEIAIVVPVYLTVLPVILYFYERGPAQLKAWILREGMRLAPFWIMTLLYWVGHVKRIPPNYFGGSNDYRLGIDWQLIIRNASKYPLWFARIYSYTLDSMSQAAGYQNWVNDLTGILALIAICYVCFRLWRTSPEYQKYILLALAWMAVFLIVPVYSGGYFWHGNLALCGFCMLFGLAADWLVTRLRGQAVRYGSIALLVVTMVALTRANTASCLVSGIHSETYRINSTILAAPPVPLNRISGPALVYIEDRKSYGEWSLGSGSLFRYLYLDLELNQVLVPSMDQVTAKDRIRWFRHPNAFFFRYDDQYRWLDDTEKFRALASKTTQEQAGPPKITSLGPPETHAGVGFNVQPNGESAMSIVGTDFERGAKILVNGHPQPIAYGNPEWVTTSIAREIYSKPGTVVFQLQNPDGSSSNTFTFRVLK